MALCIDVLLHTPAPQRSSPAFPASAVLKDPEHRGFKLGLEFGERCYWP